MVNKVIAIGNLGRDAEVKFTQGGQPVASFSVAATEKWNDRDGNKQERTEWIRCVLWGKQAESLQPYLVKGKQVYIEGRMQTRSWDDKDGNKKYQTEVKVDRLQLLGGGGDGSGSGGSRARSTRRGDDEGGGAWMENELPRDNNKSVGGGFDDDEY